MQLYNRNYRQVLEKTSAVDSKKTSIYKIQFTNGLCCSEIKRGIHKRKSKKYTGTCNTFSLLG